MKIKIGHATDGSPVHLDAKNLIYSRALIQANSGGGKSGLLRIIAEQVAAHIPTIIIDKEGEYHTLREKVDLILVGHEKGELAADVRSAGLLAKKLVELGASAVIDLSSFTSAPPQHEFVKAFLESLLHLPKSLWHPTLIIIDEAHIFAPESGMGQSVALESVYNLMTLGRKRGLGGILATTRLAKLHKNAADANNIFIGRTILDVDQARAVKTLGFKPKDNVLLRDLEPRLFFAFGPDLDFNGVAQFRTATCATTIPKAGEKKSLIPPAASNVVKDLAKKLEDLPQEAEQEARTLADAKRQIKTLSDEVRKLKAGQQPREQDIKSITELQAQLEKARAHVKEKIRVVEKRVVISGDLSRLEALVKRAETLAAQTRDNEADLLSVSSTISQMLSDVQAINKQELQAAQPATVAAAVGPKDTVVLAQVPFSRDSVASRVLKRQSAPALSDAVNGHGDVKNITGGAVRMLKALAPQPEVRVTRSQLATLARMKPTGGSFGSYVSRLKTAGLMIVDGDYYQITQAGLDFLGADIPSAPRTPEEHLQRWLSTPLISGGAAKMLKLLFALKRNGMPGLSRKELASEIEMESSGGSFGSYLSRLRSNGLIQDRGDLIEASDLLFQ